MLVLPAAGGSSSRTCRPSRRCTTMSQSRPLQAPDKERGVCAVAGSASAAWIAASVVLQSHCAASLPMALPASMAKSSPRLALAMRTRSSSSSASSAPSVWMVCTAVGVAGGRATPATDRLRAGSSLVDADVAGITAESAAAGIRGGVAEKIALLPKASSARGRGAWRSDGVRLRSWNPVRGRPRTESSDHPPAAGERQAGGFCDFLAQRPESARARRSRANSSSICH